MHLPGAIFAWRCGQSRAWHFDPVGGAQWGSTVFAVLDWIEEVAGGAFFTIIASDFRKL